MAIINQKKLFRNLKTRHFIAALTIIILAYIGWNAFLTKMTPHIARVNISGIIEDNPELLELLKKISSDTTVKALVVSISSPGGTTYGGESIFRAIREVSKKKPVVSDIRTLAASAAYMVACAGNVIVSAENSIVGSIGTIVEYAQIKTFLDKLGISFETIKSSPMKGEPSLFRVPNEQSKSMIALVVSDSYQWFVSLVGEQRHLSRDEVLRLADGRILTGRQAKSVGLVDKLGGEDQVLEALYSLGVDKNLKILNWQPSTSYFPFSFGNFMSMLVNSLLLQSKESISIMGHSSLDGLLSIWQVTDR